MQLPLCLPWSEYQQAVRIFAAMNDVLVVFFQVFSAPLFVFVL